MAVTSREIRQVVVNKSKKGRARHSLITADNSTAPTRIEFPPLKFGAVVRVFCQVYAGTRFYMIRLDGLKTLKIPRVLLEFLGRRKNLVSAQKVTKNNPRAAENECRDTPGCVDVGSFT